MSEEIVRVLLLTHSYSPEVSPPQRRWDTFVFVMRQAGWHVNVVTPRTNPRGSGEPRAASFWSTVKGAHGETILSYRSLRKPRCIAGKIIKHAMDGMLMLPGALLQARPNVIIATAPALPTMFIGLLVAKIYRRPFILEMRDAWPELISDSRILRWKWLTKLAHRAVRTVQRHATTVVTVTEGFANTLAQDDVRRVQTIHNGISTRNFEAIPVTITPETSSMHVLYLGNLGESQGLESIIRASTIARNDVEVRIVGSGTAIERLRRFAAEINADIDFREPARGEELRAHYRWADTCVVSLRDDWASFDHTVPSKIYELLSLGLHITGLVKGEAAEVIAGNLAGDIVDHDPAKIAELWSQLSADRGRLIVGTSGQEWVFEKASLEKLGMKYVDIINEIHRQGANCEN